MNLKRHQPEAVMFNKRCGTRSTAGVKLAKCPPKIGACFREPSFNSRLLVHRDVAGTPPAKRNRAYSGWALVVRKSFGGPPLEFPRFFVFVFSSPTPVVVPDLTACLLSRLLSPSPGASSARPPESGAAP